MESHESNNPQKAQSSIACRSTGQSRVLQEKVKMTYRIVRMYFRGGRRVISRGLTLEEAQAHCSDPETSSSTATSAVARRRTNRLGPWFDGYEED